MTTPTLPADTLARVHELMVKGRVLEERLITMWRQGDGYFWIGGPGEEAFNVPLGMLVDKGSGVAHDYLHLHYRSSGTMLAMGAEPIDAMRQMKNTASDPYSGGRNFAGHYSIRKWNVAPVSSPIEVQFSMAPGTAIAQKRHGGRGITIVQGGDAGTAEADFYACLTWSTRKGAELPVLMVVTNNRWGISTAYETQHPSAATIADRARGFGMPAEVVDGNDVEASWAAIARAMEYVRTERKPYLLEALVSRLRGHSSATGASFVKAEDDCLARFEATLEARGVKTRAEMDDLRARLTAEYLELSKKVIAEPQPDGSTVFDHLFAETNLVGGGR
ncbi:MAG: thiamine pyrophosphate-dependent dehydrogenase E1 component subunit alpha [Polyangiales bacterium]